MALPKVPLDIKALAKAGQVFEDEFNSEATIEVLVDTTASKELIALSRKVLAVRPGTVDLRVVGFSTDIPKLNSEASLTIIVAGSSPYLRRMTEIALWSDLDAVVLTEDPALLLASVAEEDALEIAEGIIEVDVHAPHEDLEKNLARWFILNLRDMRLSLGAAFPFMRHAVAKDLALQSSLENAVVAAVFFLPGADLPIITLNQCKLLYKIAVINEIPLSRERLVDAALVVVSAFGLRAASRFMQKRFAPLGWLIRGGIAFGATMALGHLAHKAYSQGGGAVELVGRVIKRPSTEDRPVSSNEMIVLHEDTRPVTATPLSGS